jgi:hypothetical protein
VANPEHVKIIKKGIEAWNAWRVTSPEIRPDLSSANLSGANLVRANMRGADLSGANLFGATGPSRRGRRGSQWPA